MILRKRYTTKEKALVQNKARKPKHTTRKHIHSWHSSGWWVLLLTLWLSACYYPTPEHNDGWNVPNTEKPDSVNFRTTHHYWRNFNFCVVADSLTLLSRRPGDDSWSTSRDSVRIDGDDRLVVADIAKVPSDSTDSIWVKVARDQFTQGWIREKHLLQSAIPDTPISFFIHHFSQNTTIFVLGCLGLFILFLLIRTARHRSFPLIHFNDIGSFYPTLLCLIVSGAATLYGSVQHFVPETWVEFYYHPTLNPFELPPILALFIASVWLIIIVAGAVIEDVRHQPDVESRLAYLAGLAGVCAVLYLVFTLAVHIYVGYPLLIAYWVFALRTYSRHNAARYLCGHCGHLLKRKGRCPHCGKMNQ